MSTDPEFFVIEAPINETGLNHGDLHKILYDIIEAIKAICDKLDEDVGSVGVDYGETVGDILATAVAKLGTPKQGDTAT